MGKLYWGFSGKETTLEDVVNQAPPGWNKLVTKLIEDLWTAGWDGGVLQVKEKFGGLRFYICAGNEQIWALIREAENESYKICEQCGEPGELYQGGWMRTLCEKHAKEMNYIE